MRPWLWESGSELRAPAPPAFNSQPFREALAEVRQIAETRTPLQMRLRGSGPTVGETYTPPGHWNAIASDLIRERGIGDLNAARTLALMNLAMADAAIGCWDSKFTYWVIRPWQADPRSPRRSYSLAIPRIPRDTACFRSRRPSAGRAFSERSRESRANGHRGVRLARLRGHSLPLRAKPA